MKRVPFSCFLPAVAMHSFPTLMTLTATAVAELGVVRRFLASREMKTLAIVLSAFFVAAYAMAADSPIQLRLGAPTHTKAPPGSATPGSAWVQFPVRVTNTSARPIWLEGYSLATPFYRIFTRQTDSSAWTDRGVGFCGTGAATHQLASGATTTFSVSVPARYIGQQIRVELPILDSPRDSKPVTVSSDVRPIQ